MNQSTDFHYVQLICFLCVFKENEDEHFIVAVVVVYHRIGKRKSTKIRAIVLLSGARHELAGRKLGAL